MRETPTASSSRSSRRNQNDFRCAMKGIFPCFCFTRNNKIRNGPQLGKTSLQCIECGHHVACSGCEEKKGNDKSRMKPSIKESSQKDVLVNGDHRKLPSMELLRYCRRCVKNKIAKPKHDVGMTVSRLVPKEEEIDEQETVHGSISGSVPGSPFSAVSSLPTRMSQDDSVTTGTMGTITTASTSLAHTYSDRIPTIITTKKPTRAEDSLAVGQKWRKFAIECQGGERIPIEDDQLLMKLMIFHETGSYRHEIRQDDDDIILIQKPDWTKAMAQRLIQLLITGRMELLKQEQGDRSDSQSLMETLSVATQMMDQIKQSVIVRHPMNRQYDIKHDKDLLEDIINVWSKRRNEFSFKLQDNVTNEITRILDTYVWGKLLKQGIVFLNYFHMLSFEVQKRNEREDSAINPQLNNIFKVGCVAPLFISIYHTCSLLYMNHQPSQSRLSHSKHPTTTTSNNSYYNNNVTIYVYLYLGSAASIIQIANTYNVTLFWEETDDGQEATWLTGSPEALRKLLKAIKPFIIPTRLNHYCVLCISHPTMMTLRRFIYACQKCEKNRAAMIFNYKDNDYIVSRKYNDVMETLKILSEKTYPPGENLAMTGPFTILGTTRDYYRRDTVLKHKQKKKEFSQQIMENVSDRTLSKNIMEENEEDLEQEREVLRKDPKPMAEMESEQVSVPELHLQQHLQTHMETRRQLEQEQDEQKGQGQENIQENVNEQETQKDCEKKEESTREPEQEIGHMNENEKRDREPKLEQKIHQLDEDLQRDQILKQEEKLKKEMEQELQELEHEHLLEQELKQNQHSVRSTQMDQPYQKHNSVQTQVVSKQKLMKQNIVQPTSRYDVEHEAQPISQLDLIKNHILQQKLIEYRKQQQEI